MSRLTDRQREVLVLVADGLKDREIADRLQIGLYTAHFHVQEVREVYGAANRAHAVALAMRAGDLR